MKNDEERMAFALRFAQSDPAALREGDWLNLREDLVHFLGWNPRWREEIRLEDIKPLQEEVATVLRAIAEAFAPHTPGDWESRMPTLLRLGDISPQEVTKFLGDKKRGIALRV